MLSRFLQFITILLLLFCDHCVRAQNYSSRVPTYALPIPCDSRPDWEIFQEPAQTGHGVDQSVVDVLHGIGYLLLVSWWLFAAGLLVLVIAVLRKSFAVWILLWLPFLLVGWVALPPLQELHQRLVELQEFQLQCHFYDPPSRAFLAYKQRRWNDAIPYLSMLAAITLLYVPAIIHVVRFQSNRALR